VFRTLLIALAVSAWAQNISFDPMSEDVIERRVRAFTPRNATREAALKSLFEEVGCATEEQPVKGTKEPNLICTQPGQTAPVIVVGAHFDLVEAGQGVVDNWSGASLLPSLYQGLSKSARKHTFVFVGFTAEEKGLVGSRAYVKRMDRESVKAMVNLDTLGLSDTKVWVSHADKELVNLIGIAAGNMKLPVSAMNVDRVGDSDSESFREIGIPAVTIHSLTQDTLRVLHSPRDQFEALHMDAYYRSYRLILGFLALLDQKID
jgi:Iap family predicted aminopeptidase